ncbi:MULTISPECIES: Tn3 family transposase [Bacillus cereus group]|nr:MULTISPECIES: Tn3 family transposase [Bacillus cereus group]MBJ8049557.1 Tn3 family transposase [Bacillus cereus group sp. N18]HDR7392212.1 Tn3 family transposase [Bacillus toyonensis]
MNREKVTLANFQHQLNFASYWGDVIISSFDGVRIQVGVSSLHVEPNPH